MQVIGQAKPLAQILLGAWHWPIGHSLHLGGIRTNTVDTDIASQHGDLFGTEDTLVQVGI